jgi:hypothetical protein
MKNLVEQVVARGDTSSEAFRRIKHPCNLPNRSPRSKSTPKCEKVRKREINVTDATSKSTMR